MCRRLRQNWKSIEPMRSYFILGIYALMMAAFYKWEASLFLLIFAMLLEMCVLMIGVLIVGFSSPRKADDMHPIHVFGMSMIFLVCTFPLAFYLGEFYHEYSQEKSGNWLLPFRDYFWPIIAMAISIGIGYLVDMGQLRKVDRSERFTTDLVRLCIQLFGVGFITFIVLLFFRELQEGTWPNKWIPVSLIIVLRMLLEIWYLRRKKEDHVA